jgi:hypothetical protein
MKKCDRRNLDIPETKEKSTSITDILERLPNSGDCSRFWHGSQHFISNRGNSTYFTIYRKKEIMTNTDKELKQTKQFYYFVL